MRFPQKKLAYGGSNANSSVSSTQDSSSSGLKNEEGGSGEGKSNKDEKSGSKGQENSSGGGEDSNNKSSSPTTDDTTEKVNVTELITKNIIGNDAETNWDLIKTRIENLYSIWSTVSMDLAQSNMSEEKINEFNSTLNDTTLQIKEEKKSESIQKLVDMYGILLDFYNSANTGMSTNDKKLKELKYNVIIAYENVELDKWNDAKIYIEEAQKINTEILTNLENLNSYSIKKLNIILNQLLSSTDVKDKDIFYINYRNLIEEMNLL